MRPKVLVSNIILTDGFGGDSGFGGCAAPKRNIFRGASSLVLIGGDSSGGCAALNTSAGTDVCLAFGGLPPPPDMEVRSRCDGSLSGGQPRRWRLTVPLRRSAGLGFAVVAAAVVAGAVLFVVIVVVVAADRIVVHVLLHIAIVAAVVAVLVANVVVHSFRSSAGGCRRCCRRSSPHCGSCRCCCHSCRCHSCCCRCWVQILVGYIVAGQVTSTRGGSLLFLSSRFFLLLSYEVGRLQQVPP